MRETPVADNEDKPLPPVFQGDKDKTNARQIAGRVIDPFGFEKHYRTAPDGAVTRLDTKGGQPQVIVEEPEDEDEPPDNFSGLAYMPRDIGEKLQPTVVLKLSEAARPLKRGKSKPTAARKGISFGYSGLAGNVLGLSVDTGSKAKCLWMNGEHKTKRDMFIWKATQKGSATTNSLDGTIVPFSIKQVDGRKYFWASQYRVVKRDGSAAYTATIPSRTVFLSGPKDYDVLPVQVTHSGKVVLQCCDVQTFNDRPAVGSGVVTDLTKYYQSVVFNSATNGSVVLTGKLETFLPAKTVTSTSNTDGNSIAAINSCKGYRSWWDCLNTDGTGKDPNYMRVDTVSASNNVETPACADSTSSEVLFANTASAFAKAVLDDDVVDVSYLLNASYSGSSALIQEYSNVGMTDPFLGLLDRQPPYQYSGSRKVFRGSLDQDESASITAGVKIGLVEYPFFVATGTSGTTASKHQDVRHEYFHPPNGAEDDGTWDGIVDSQGLSIGKALENACGYTYSEMIGWSGIGGSGTNKEIYTADSETSVRTSACSFNATGRYYLTADASLQFSAWVECHFDFAVSETSGASDKWKWTLPEKPSASPVNVSVDLVIKHKTTETRQSLFAGVLNMPPPVRSVAYPNPYYFVPLYFGIAPAGEISADGADVCWTYQVPNIEPQPSFFGSVDVLFQGQQTSPYIAGYSQYEMALASAKRTKLAKYQDTVIASRRIKLREIGADWLFSYYGIDRPLSLSPSETDPAKLRKYGFSNALYTLMFDTVIRFEADTNQIRFWLEDVDNNAVTPSENKNAFCFRI